ncbi:MAG: flagellar motor protein MotB [Planctomycetia bacterium]|jgi:chemotaxis protein MotB
MKLVSTLVASLALLSAAACTSPQQYKAAIEEKDSQIRRLNEERAQLKAQVQTLKSSLDQANGALAEASAPKEEVALLPQQSFPELDEVGVSYGMRDGNMVISVPSTVTFAAGQATLSDEGRKALKKVASTLKKEYPSMKYSIEGHTDADPIKKSKFNSNRELSVMRAMAVLEFLVSECEIADQKCVVAGHGQYDPVAGNDKDAGKAKNRRVEIVVMKD